MNQEELTIQEVLEKHGYERRSGRIGFSSPAYKLICGLLEIKWNALSRTGKAVLRANMIDEYMGYGFVVEDGKHYASK